MSKCVAEESNLATTDIFQTLKNIQSSKATAKHIIGGIATATVNQLCGKQQDQHGTNCKWENQDGDNNTVDQQHQDWTKQNSYPNKAPLHPYTTNIHKTGSTHNQTG